MTEKIMTIEELKALYNELWEKAIYPLAERLIELGSGTIFVSPDTGDTTRLIEIFEPDCYTGAFRVWMRRDYAGIEFSSYFDGIKKVRFAKEYSAQELAENLPIVENCIAEMKKEIESLSSTTVDFSALPIISELMAVK